MELYPLYKEPYRNQFHFSAPIGWMNDINGCWYQDGLWHITYQHCADALSCLSEHLSIGHACSPDLIHWYHMTEALMRGAQFVGAPWSGSAYVDKENRLGYGENAVILANTDTLRGQCLTVSENGGKTFRNIPENPVVTLPPDGEDCERIEAQRDPKIFWLEQEECFVMIVFWQNYKNDFGNEGSMDFYRSDDMINWTMFQRISNKEIADDLEANGKNADYIRQLKNPILNECPDIFEMECDGEKYWVLHGGHSRYFIGKFRGLHFTFSEDGAEPLSAGPSFYAGQHFVNSDRIIGIFWMNRWNEETVKTYPYLHSATIPAEYTLHKTEEGLRVFRYPVEELKTIRRDGRKAESVACELCDQSWASSIFDAEIEVDCKNTLSDKLILNISDKSYELDLKQGVFKAENVDGETKIRIDTSNKLYLRILADRDAIEIFFNKGRNSYTEEFGFKAENITLSLKGDNKVSAKGEFFPLNSIW